MRQCTACLSVMAMLVALLTAPLFHMHERDEHGHQVSFVHAHLGGLEMLDSHASDEVEGNHSHAHARWVDVFTFDTFSLYIDWPIDVAITWVTPQLQRGESFVIAFVPQAHGPPGSRPFSPRSPPSIQPL